MPSFGRMTTVQIVESSCQSVSQHRSPVIVRSRRCLVLFLAPHRDGFREWARYVARFVGSQEGPEDAELSVSSGCVAVLEPKVAPFLGPRIWEEERAVVWQWSA